jgi:type I restriction enzyme, R subunit
MKGRGTRTVKADDLKKVTPSAQAKTHYVIVDAVGVTKSLKTASRPLDAQPSVSFRDLAMGVVMGVRDDETLSSLAARLARLDKQLQPEERHRIEEKAGVPLAKLAYDLFDAIDGDTIAAAATAATGEAEPDEAAMNAARDKLVNKAANVFNGPLVDLIENIRRDHEQTIDHDTLDTLLSAEWAGDTTENAKAIVEDFAGWLNINRDEIEALTVYFSQPARRSEVTYAIAIEGRAMSETRKIAAILVADVVGYSRLAGADEE